MIRVLTEEGADHICHHQYKPGTYTSLDKLMNPIWSRIAEALPMWLAPNLVTVIGFVPLCLVFVASWYIDPFFGQAPPRWLSFSWCGTMLFYQTMDAVDGKQARRTGSSSPLGQLFDHGLDCVSNLLQHAAVASIACSSSMPWILFSMEAMMIGFLLAAWQEYHTGVFPTAAGEVGVTECQFSVMSTMLLAGVVGPEVWQGFLLTAPDSLLLKATAAVVCAMWVAPVVTTLKAAGPTAIQELVPIAATFVAARFWQPELLAPSPRLVLLLTGLNLFWMNIQLIVFTMARMPYSSAQWCVLPFVAAVGASWALPVSTARIVLISNTFVFGCWLMVWIASVVQQLKLKLGVSMFSIKKRS